MCLSTDAGEVNPLCNRCFAKFNEAMDKVGEFEYEDLCDECKDLPNHYCFCCDADQRASQKDLGIINGICRHCRER